MGFVPKRASNDDAVRGAAPRDAGRHLRAADDAGLRRAGPPSADGDTVPGYLTSCASSRRTPAEPRRAVAGDARPHAAPDRRARPAAAGQAQQADRARADLSVETVKDHVAAVLRALNVTSRTQAVLAVSQMTQRAGRRASGRPARSAGARPWSRRRRRRAARAALRQRRLRAAARQGAGDVRLQPDLARRARGRRRSSSNSSSPSQRSGVAAARTGALRMAAVVGAARPARLARRASARRPTVAGARSASAGAGGSPARSSPRRCGAGRRGASCPTAARCSRSR